MSDPEAILESRPSGNAFFLDSLHCLCVKYISNFRFNNLYLDL